MVLSGNNSSPGSRVWQRLIQYGNDCFGFVRLTYPLTAFIQSHSGALSRGYLAASYASSSKAINGLQGGQTSSVSDHYRVFIDSAGNETNSKVPFIGRQKVAIKVRREAKRILRRDSRSHRQREEESIKALVQMGDVESIGMARDSRDHSPIEARNQAQAHYLNAIKNKQLIFATGEAGCGKTFISAGKLQKHLS